MHRIVFNFIVLISSLLEGGEGEPSIPVYQLASLYWWGALLLIGGIILVVWLLIAWQARYFDRQLSLAGSHAAHHPTKAAQAVPLRGAEASMPPLIYDDLTLIEGIGPVISRLLQSKGIVTFAQLAETDPQILLRFMREANLRLADTNTWPEQARLAASGDREALRAFQSYLKGGRRV
jgi:predicted flap endonuclease-1-like 5' DNA nuclease